VRHLLTYTWQWRRRWWWYSPLKMNDINKIIFLVISFLILFLPWYENENEKEREWKMLSKCKRTIFLEESKLRLEVSLLRTWKKHKNIIINNITFPWNHNHHKKDFWLLKCVCSSDEAHDIYCLCIFCLQNLVMLKPYCTFYDRIINLFEEI
jgi:hypothetical protein